MTWELVHYGRPLTLNAERRLHHMARAKAAREVQEAFYWLGLKAGMPKPIKGPVMVTVMVANRESRRWIQDVDACHPTVKAALDGLVKGGFLSEDDPDRVASITYVRPELGARRDALVLRVEEL